MGHRLRSTMAHGKPKFQTKAQKAAFQRRVQTLKNKDRELSVLCDIFVCVICYDSDGQLYHWPERPEDVRRIAANYRGLSEEDRRKHAVDLNGFLSSEATKANRASKKPRLAPAYPDSDGTVDNLSHDELGVLLSRIDAKLVQFQERQSLVMDHGGRTEKDFEGRNEDVGSEKSATGPRGEENTDEIDIFGGLEDLDCGFQGFGFESFGGSSMYI
ncbi:PREDICTED: agamous-like MADS-box protein AGL103 [Tarenaya hassleriana]|uniref:agamous-like MADS-box protein AGL103 n=1 Tax=Tarenaya hassleriana TaxID=28532 RepID=UPI00053C772D|nr:PREDICTED: agamous-like MADS-box protein AGL103 [Tarenaya hassleriana]